MRCCYCEALIESGQSINKKNQFWHKKCWASHQRILAYRDGHEDVTIVPSKNKGIFSGGNWHDKPKQELIEDVVCWCWLNEITITWSQIRQILGFAKTNDLDALKRLIKAKKIAVVPNEKPKYKYHNAYLVPIENNEILARD